MCQARVSADTDDMKMMMLINADNADDVPKLQI